MEQAARYDAWLLIELMPKGVLFSFTMHGAAAPKMPATFLQLPRHQSQGQHAGTCRCGIFWMLV